MTEYALLIGLTDKPNEPLKTFFFFFQFVFCQLSTVLCIFLAKNIGYSSSLMTTIHPTAAVGQMMKCRLIQGNSTESYLSVWMTSKGPTQIEKQGSVFSCTPDLCEDQFELQRDLSLSVSPQVSVREHIIPLSDIKWQWLPATCWASHSLGASLLAHPPQFCAKSIWSSRFSSSRVCLSATLGVLHC